MPKALTKEELNAIREQVCRYTAYSLPASSMGDPYPFLYPLSPSTSSFCSSYHLTVFDPYIIEKSLLVITLDFDNIPSLEDVLKHGFIPKKAPRIKEVLTFIIGWMLFFNQQSPILYRYRYQGPVR